MNTFEMDGLLSQEDINNRHFVMGECLGCSQWSEWDTRVGKWQCAFCGEDKYNRRELRSIRTWLSTRHLRKTRKSKKGTNA